MSGAATKDGPVNLRVGLTMADAENRRRWLVLTGESPSTVEGQSYVERLARAHARRSETHEVVVVIHGRGRSKRRTRAERGVELVELDLGPLPSPPTEVNRPLMRAASLAARLDELARSRAFDLVLVEGAFGALVGVPLGERLGLPVVLGLPDCEVRRRGNRLQRGQLYVAELEHWGCDRAALVVAPSAVLLDPLRRHYGSQRAEHVVAPAPVLEAPVDAPGLLERLGVPAAPTLVLAPADVDPEERARLVANHGPSPILLIADGVWRSNAQGEVRIARRAPQGRALAALMKAARAVVAVDPADPRRDEALALGVPTGWARPAEVARVLR